MDTGKQTVQDKIVTEDKIQNSIAQKSNLLVN